MQQYYCTKIRAIEPQKKQTRRNIGMRIVKVLTTFDGGEYVLEGHD